MASKPFSFRFPRLRLLLKSLFQFGDHAFLIRDWLREHVPNVAPAGRHGMHKYTNQDHSMMAALLAARNLAGTDARDPWKINTDAESHEETSADADTAGRIVPKPARPALPRA